MTKIFHSSTLLIYISGFKITVQIFFYYYGKKNQTMAYKR